METSTYTATELAEMAGLAAEADYEELMAAVSASVEVHELGWTELRREIMRRGGIAAGPYTRHFLPGGTYRLHGAAPDVLAADMRDEGWGTWDDAEQFLAQLQRLYEVATAGVPAGPFRVERARRARLAAAA